MISRPESSHSSHSQEAGADNPAFVPDDNDDTENNQHEQTSRDQTLTTAEIHDTSEAPPDVLVDLEGIPGADNLEEGETTVELTDYQPGESSTDVAQEQREEGPDDAGMVFMMYS